MAYYKERKYLAKTNHSLLENSFDESVLMPADFAAIDSRVRSCGPRLEHVTFSLSCGFVPQSTSKRGEPGFMTG